MMKSQSAKKFFIWGMVMLTPLGLYTAQHSLAASPKTASPATLIDRDFENCARKHFTQRFCNRIDATADQREKLDTLFSTAMEQTRPVREELRHGLLDMSNMIASDDTPDEAIIKKAHELRDLHAKVQDERLTTMLKARKILTKEQRDKLNERFTEALTNGSPRLGRLGI